MYNYFQRLIILMGLLIGALSCNQDLMLKNVSAVYYDNDNSRSNLKMMFSSISEIDNAVRDLEFRSRSTTDPAEAKEIRFLITQLIETRNQIQRTKNTLLQMSNLSPQYRRQNKQYFQTNDRKNITNKHRSNYVNDQNYSQLKPMDDNFYNNAPAKERNYSSDTKQTHDSYLLNSAYFVKDTPVQGATDLQLDFLEGDIYDIDLDDFVDARLPLSRINPYSNNLQLSEAGKQIIKARFELAEYLFFNGLKERGLFVVRDLLHSISVDDTWSMNQIIQLGDKLRNSNKNRDVAVHIFKLGFRKYRGLPVAANFLIRAGMISYYFKDIKDACLSFMTIRDGYPYEKKIFIKADTMAKKLHCPPNSVRGNIIW